VVYVWLGEMDDEEMGGADASSCACVDIVAGETFESVVSGEVVVIFKSVFGRFRNRKDQGADHTFVDLAHVAVVA
jgi:hypothetical protein